MESSLSENTCTSTLEAEINRFTGLLIVEAVEIAVIIATSIAAVGFLMTWKTRSKEAKIASANLILKFLDTLREDKFKKLWREIANPDIKEYDPKTLSPYLNTFEEIAIFTHDNTLQRGHVMEFYGVNLKGIRDDDFIKNYIEEKFNSTNGFAFVNLKRLLRQVQHYGI